MFRPDVLQKCYNFIEVNVLNMFKHPARTNNDQKHIFMI